MLPEPPPPPPPARSVAAPAFGNPAPQRLPDPFARPGKKGAVARTGDVSDGLVRSWRRARRGLWWVGLALFLFLLAPLSLAGFGIAEKFGTKLPSQSPGYLKVDHLPSDVEIRWAALFGPIALGLLLLLLGRFGVSNAPRSSYAKGMATASALVTLLGVLGAICFAVPTVMMLVEGIFPVLLQPEDTSGQLQRAGLFAMTVCLPLAELWFVIALGRMGAGLHNARLASRGTRFLVYVGLIGLLYAAYLFAEATFPREVQSFVNEHVQPQWDKLGEHKVTAGFGLIGFAGLVVWFWSIRLVTGARRAIREWLDQNEPGT
jgi:hypothetical protein